MTEPKLLVMQQDDFLYRLFEPLKEVAEVDVVRSDQAVMERILPQYDAFLIELGLQLRAPLIERCQRLKIVATSTTGTDHMDVQCLEQSGIQLISLKYDTDFLSRVPATAEMAFALLLAVIRHVPRAFESVQRGEWDRLRFRGNQLFEKTFGILGYGRLGKIIQDFALGFHMRVIANDILDLRPTREGVEMVNLDTLLTESDVLSLHIHLSDPNYHFMNRARLAKMKKGAILINTSRGAVIDQDALLEALESGHLAGAGLDVLEGEWISDMREHPVVKYAREHDNLVITPHLGGTSNESMEGAMAFTVNKLKHALQKLT